MSKLPRTVEGQRRNVWLFPHPGSKRHGDKLNQVGECTRCNGTFVPGFPHSCKYSLTNRTPAEEAP